MRLFPFLLFFIAIGELFGYYLAVKYRNNLWFYNLLNPVMHLLYFAIMYFAIKSKKFKTFILTGGAVYIIVSSTTYFLYCYGKDVFNQWMYVLGISILIVCLVRKLYEMLEDPQDLDFLRNPFFYILIFTLLFYTVTIPDFAILNWVSDVNINSLALVNNVSDFLNILLYAAYTIAFLWIRKTGLY